jgi:hypothetical protein
MSPNGTPSSMTAACFGPGLSPIANTFACDAEYFDAIAAVALEEARAAVAGALKQVFTECSLNVHLMFTECSLNVH